MRVAPADLSILRRVRTAALEVLAGQTAAPCDDLEGCLATVYMAGVADALGWVSGECPLPRSYPERAL